MCNIMKKELFRNADEKEKIAWIRLSRSYNVGTKTMLKFLEIYGSLSHAVAEIKALSRANKSKIRIADEKSVAREIKAASKYGAKLICPFDREYPNLLLQISDFPLVLTVKGNIECLDANSIAIVGSRNCSMVSKKFTESMAFQLAKQGFCIASGMASGVDAAAHHGALNFEGGRTIAVLAGGIDNIYPKDNEGLYHKIADSGLIISEEAFGSVPGTHNFPKRNRIITGLSLGVVIVEASESSGSLITARFGLEQGREVFAVPGHPTDRRNAGNNSLIKQGAILVEDVDDIIEVLSFNKASELDELNENKLKFDNSKKVDTFELQMVREKILGLLCSSSVAVDALFEELKCDPNIFKQAMVELELAGILCREKELNMVYLQKVA